MKKHLLSLSVFSAFALFSLGFVGTKSYANEATVLNDEVMVISKENVDNEDLLRDIRSICGYNFKITNTFTGIVNGYKIQVNENYLPYLRKLNSVETVSHDNVVATQSADEYKDYTSALLTEAPENDSLADMHVSSKAGSRRGEGTLIAVLDSSFSYKHNAFKDFDASENVQTKLSQDDVSSIKSTKGFHAPNGQYINSKVPYVWDYGGTLTYSEDNGYSASKEDAIVESTYSDHGMHVSSIASANGQFEGVAPYAQLAFLKVFGEVTNIRSTPCLESMIVNALNDAYYLGADVINMSLGSDLNEFTREDEKSASVIACNRLKDAGVVISVAAGNSGKGNWSQSGAYAFDTTQTIEQGILGSYATYDATTVVAASTLSNDSSNKGSYSYDGHTFQGNDQVVNRTTSSGETKFKTQKPFYSLIKEGERFAEIEYVMVPGVGAVPTDISSDDPSKVFEDDYANIDVTGKIAVVERGDIAFSAKVKNAHDHGAIGCIIYNHTSDTMGYFDFSSANEDDLIPTLGVGHETGVELGEADNKIITISVDRTADFSSDGMLADLTIKPEITTPGQNIAGAVNLDASGRTSYNTYAYYNGTSMATPNFTGVVSSLLAAQQFETEEEKLAYKHTITTRLMTTADPLLQSDGTPVAVRKQGAGLVNLDEALSGMYLESDAGNGKVELKNNADIAAGIIDFNVTIHNPDKLTSKWDALLEVTIPDTEYLDGASFPKYKGVKMQSTNQYRLGSSKFEVQLTGEETQAVHVRYELSKAQKAYIDSIYEDGIQVEGFLNLTSQTEGEPTLSIPYLGFYGDFSKGDAVEPFDFEKEEGKIYGSDLLNSLMTDTGLNRPNSSFGSCVFVSGGGLEGVSLEGILNNTVKPYSLYTPIKTTKIGDTYTMYAGATGYADTIAFMQFVNRTVVDNVIYLKDRMGNTVLTDHMFDSLFGSEDVYTLYKSRASTDLISGDTYLIAHRAYTIIPLTDYADGTYTIEFHYTLASGDTQTKIYKLNISKDATVGSSSYFDYSSSSNTFEIDYSESIYDVICTGAQDIKVDGSKITINLGKLQLKNNISFKIVQDNYISITGIINPDGTAVLLTQEVDVGAKFRLSAQEDFTSANGKVSGTLYTVTLYGADNKKVTLKKSYTILLDTNAAAFTGAKNATVYEVNAKNQTVTNKNTSLSESGILKITTNYPKFLIGVKGGSNQPSGGNGGGCGGSVIATSLVLATIALGAGVLGVSYKHSKNKKED